MGLRSCSNQVAATIAPVTLGLVTDVGGTDAAFWSNGLLSALVVAWTIGLHRSAASRAQVRVRRPQAPRMP
jgi:hypothetical protein